LKKALPEFALLFVTLLWGGTFLATRLALAETNPATLVAFRFAVGAFALALFVRKRPTRKEWIAGGAVGLSMVAGYLLQAYGLEFTTSSKSAFITALYVPLVPILQIPFGGRKPGIWIWFGVLLSFCGMALLSVRQGAGFEFGLGEWLTFGAAVASAAQIILIGRMANEGDTTRITAIQLAVVALACSMFVPFQGPLHLGFHAAIAAVILGLAATAGALWLMNWAQKVVAADRATLIYAMEPVWAAVIGALAGEHMSLAGACGGLLVVGGILAAEFGPRLRRGVPVVVSEGVPISAAILHALADEPELELAGCP